MTNLRPFEIILMGVFGFAAVIALAVVSLWRGGDEARTYPYGREVIIWGTFEALPMNRLIEEVKNTDEGFSVVSYVQKDAQTFDDDLVNAIAEGRSPDIVMIPHEKLVSLRTKLLPISYKNYPERTFYDTYIEGARIFMRPDGIYGLPFAVDPLVLYWNRDIFSSAGLVNPPRTWEELAGNTVSSLRRTGSRFEIEQSAISLGEYGNVTNAKRILAMLMLQAGSSLVEEVNDSYRVEFNRTTTENSRPAGTAALDFYTRFSNPTDATYTWGRSLQNDRLMFLGGNLAMYFGLGSEFSRIARDNPNLNFDIAPVPQGGDATTLRNYGDFYAFAVPRGSKNTTGAYAVASVLAREENARTLAEGFDLTPVHARTIQTGSSDPYDHILYQTSLISRGWLDPNPTKSSEIFKQMVEDVTSGRERVGTAIGDAEGRLELLF